MAREDLVVVNGRLCIFVACREKHLFGVAYPIEEVYLMHEKEPMPVEPGSRTELRTCYYTRSKYENLYQDDILSRTKQSSTRCTIHA